MQILKLTKMPLIKLLTDNNIEIESIVEFIKGYKKHTWDRFYDHIVEIADVDKVTGIKKVLTRENHDFIPQFNEAIRIIRSIRPLI